mmetsp:Transcript_19914/g.23081  ORF Transcript_19914/g.23081 Transcript_19914/m.23081 type:complete len:165 (-) Transcript_19914:372-866(-)
MLPNTMFTSDFTPRLFKSDFSPANYRLNLPGFRSPMAQQEDDNSRTNIKLPNNDNLDFESKFLAVTQNYYPYLNSKFVPRTPVSVIRNTYDNQMKPVSTSKGLSFEQAPVAPITNNCPCCGQGIPNDKKLIRKDQESRVTPEVPSKPKVLPLKAMASQEENKSS